MLALSLMVAQSFLYNSVFFTYGLVLSHFYQVPEQHVGFYLLPLALGNFCGPLLLGTWFDTLGRRMMIGGTFALSGLLLLATALLFDAGILTEATQTVAWLVIFFFASAAASSASASGRPENISTDNADNFAGPMPLAKSCMRKRRSR